ncbi:MAG: hypothetical protein RLY31_533 [Bacteroidota bacterium]|jgi:TRAP-type mannitol/chloroaromatic compound transport system substrate-binding protein
MKRKTFFRSLAAGTIALPWMIRFGGGKPGAQTGGAGAPGIISSRRYQWRMVTTWPPNFPVIGEGCLMFAEWVKEMSGGRMEIKVYGGGEMVPALETFDAVRNGAVEMGSGAAYYWVGKSPAATFFTSVPFGMNAQQVNAWLMNGDGMSLWTSLYADFGLVPFPGGNTGIQSGGWFNREIRSVADLKGLKMRIPGLGGRVFERAGGTPVLLSAGDLYTGLERGIIDAAEWVSPYHDYLLGLHEITKYCYMPGWQEAGSVLELMANKQQFEALPADLQAIIRTAAHRMNHWVLSEFETKNSHYLDKLTREHHVEFRTFPDQVLDTLRSSSEEVIASVTDADPFARKVFENYRRFQEQCAGWARTSEKVYYNTILR